MPRPTPKPVANPEGFALVEKAMQPIARAIAEGLRRAGRSDWRFFVVCFEYEGGGTSYVSSEPERADMISAIRSQGERLARVPAPASGGPTIELRPAGADANLLTLDPYGIEVLATVAQFSGVLVREVLPPGFGFALLLYLNAARAGSHFYVASAEREGAAAMLLELAEILEAGEDRPPGEVR